MVLTGVCLFSICAGGQGEIILEGKGNSNKDDENNGHPNYGLRCKKVSKVLKNLCLPDNV